MRNLIVFILLLAAMPGYAAVNNTMQVNVRQDGSDNNGGGCDPAVAVSCATSPSASPTVSYTDLTIGATTTQFTSSGNPVGTSVPGHMLHILSGSGCTAGFYEPLSQTGGTATADRSMGTAASVCTAKLDGALATIAEGILATGAQTHMTINICGSCGTGSFTVTSALSSFNDDTTLWGYGTTLQDGGTKPVITSSTGSINMLQTGAEYVVVNNIKFLAVSGFTQYAIQTTSNTGLAVLNSQLIGSGTSSTAGIDAFHAQFSTTYIFNSEISHWDWGVFIATSGGDMHNLLIDSSYVHNNATAGVTDGNNQSSSPFLWASRNSVFDSNGYCMWMQSSSGESAGEIWFQNSVCSNSTNDGINNQSAFASNPNTNIISNSIIYGNGGWGVNFKQSSCPGGSALGNMGQIAFNNGVGSNTSGNYQCLSSVYDVSLTASPFTSSSNFALNNTSGGGAALKAAGFPGVMPAGTGHADIGALPSQATGGAAPHAVAQ